MVRASELQTLVSECQTLAHPTWWFATSYYDPWLRQLAPHFGRLLDEGVFPKATLAADVIVRPPPRYKL